jgi:hypothetical protein
VGFPYNYRVICSLFCINIFKDMALPAYFFSTELLHTSCLGSVRSTQRNIYGDVIAQILQMFLGPFRVSSLLTLA